MKKTLIISALVILLGTASAHAQSYVPLEPLPCIPGGGVVCTSATSTFTFSNYIQYMFNLVIAVAASAAVFMIVYGGFKYVTTDSWSGKNEGREKVMGALLGLLLILTSYIVLRTVDPRLVAIRSDLVKPLDIDYSQYKSTQSILDQITNLSNNYLTQSQLTRDQIAQAQNTLAQDRQALSGKSAQALDALKAAQAESPEWFNGVVPNAQNMDWFCKGLVNSAPTELIETSAYSACQDYLQASNTANGHQQQIYIDIARQGIDAQLGSCIGRPTIDVAACMVSINQYVTNQKDNLVNNLSADPAAVVDYGYYANAMLEANSRLKLWANQTIAPADYGQIISVTQTFLDRIPASDTATRAKFIHDRDALLVGAHADQQKINDGTYLNAYRNGNSYTPIN